MSEFDSDSIDASVGQSQNFVALERAIEIGDYASARRLLGLVDEEVLNEAQLVQVASWRALLARDPLAVYVMLCAVLVLAVIAWLLFARG